ncbi:hypothetical protein [Kitasatospora sp. NPDC056184]|uniref:hypothetical protein n=1 Tax=Kitasatospora sp. NPDC056184 TaxID=3345738 RepID=UPI0035DB08A9
METGETRETGEIGALLREREERAWRRARRSRGWGVNALGLLALGAWLWAVGLAFLPASHEFPNGRTVHCGSPVFYDSIGRRGAYDHCADVADNRMRGAVGVGLATLPLSVGWLWRTVGTRVHRAEERP